MGDRHCGHPGSLAVGVAAFAALAGLVGVLAAHEESAELVVVAAAILMLRAGVLPWLLRRALAGAGEAHRETAPLVNVSASLLAAAVLTLIAYAVSRPLVELAPSPATHAVPIGLTVVLIGLFVLVARRRALSELVGFLLVDNGITVIGFLSPIGPGQIVSPSVGWCRSSRARLGRVRAGIYRILQTRWEGGGDDRDRSNRERSTVSRGPGAWRARACRSGGGDRG